MTLPDEEHRSLETTRQFLLDLCDPGTTPRVPGPVRKRASQCLRHYPMRHRVEELYENDSKAKAQHKELGWL